MLDDTSVDVPENEDLPHPPTGRRAASRPAGPPSPAPSEPAPSEMAASATPDVLPEASQQTELMQAPAAAEAVTGEGTGGSGGPLEVSAGSDESTSADHVTGTRQRHQPTRTTRAARTHRITDAGHPKPAGEEEGAATTPVSEYTTEIPETPEQPTPEEPLPVEEPAEPAAQVVMPGEVTAAESGVPEAAAAGEPAPEAAVTSAVEAALAAAEREAAQRPRAAQPAQTKAVLDSLAAAIAGGATQAGQAEETEAGQTEETEAGQAQPTGDQAGQEAALNPESAQGADLTGPRRRRRRGGRRRHHAAAAEQGAEETGEAEEAPEAKGAEPSVPGPVPAAAEQPSAVGEAEVPVEGEIVHHRRRRRRHRGEEAILDEETGVLVHVREPRTSGAADEVSGIAGSTRLEAKRQRRREGRAAGRRRAPILSEAEFLARRESVNRLMVVRQRPDYTQVGVLEDGVLVEHYVDRKASASLIGNIYLGRVQNVLPSMEAAFVDIGRGRNAVLYAGEVDWDSYPGSSGQRRIEDVLKPGQSVLVQVSKDPVGAKGARLTGHISIPGRFVVYSPDGQLSGISRKLPEPERRRLKEVLDASVGDGASVIVRTAAEGATQEELIRDVQRLKAQWEVIDKKVQTGSTPQQLYAEPDLTLRIVRDLFTEDFGQLIVSGDGGPQDAFDTIEAYVNHVAPHLVDRLVRWDGTQGDLFAQYHVDDQITKALERKVFLPSGGSLVIDRTEAMTVIDVNTGKFTGAGGNLEETVTRNNLEAAEEIVRQLRLRDLGGIVVIDFIDMVLPANRELLLRRLVECLGRDRTRHQVSEVTSLGLVQLTRKKIGTGLAEAFTAPCEQCGGRGYIRHDEPVESQAPADGGERSHDHGRRGGRTRGSASTARRASAAGKPGEPVDAGSSSAPVAVN